jgi:ribosome-associated translation inhibitor RaiA
MKDTGNAGPTVRHKLQIHFDAHEYEPGPDELARMSDNLDALARQAGDFPRADLRVVIEKNKRNNEFVVKLTLLLPRETLVTSDHDAVLHAAFRRALDSLELRFKGHVERLGGVDARQEREEAAKLQPTIEAGPVDEGALDAAAAARDYAAFRAAVAPFEDWLRLRVGRWVERYPEVQARMGRDFDVLDLTEGVLLAAFEQHEHRHAEVRYRDWLEGLIDPTVRAFAHDPERERENVNMARSAIAASGG